MDIDRRKDIRFLAQDDVIVAVQNGFNKIGKVKDISLGGLSFEYIHDEDLKWVDSKRYVLIWVSDFNMYKIPCKVVYDLNIQIPPEYNSLTIQFKTKRCGVQFETLTEYQLDQLDFFLKNYTKGRA